MKYFSIQFHKGFTLIETLFAVLLFSASLVALMTVAGKGISATSIARQQITAHYLAQEGLEVVRNVRDVNFIQKQAWNTGIADCTGTTPCQVIYHSNLPIPGRAPTLGACDNNCEVFQTFGVFVDSTLNPTPSRSGFVREIRAFPVGTDGDEYKIVSRVEWNAKSVQRNVLLTTILKKWQ